MTQFCEIILVVKGKVFGRLLRNFEGKVRSGGFLVVCAGSMSQNKVWVPGETFQAMINFVGSSKSWKVRDHTSDWPTFPRFLTVSSTYVIALGTEAVRCQRAKTASAWCRARLAIGKCERGGWQRVARRIKRPFGYVTSAYSSPL